jgi:hypothetical protein
VKEVGFNNITIMGDFIWIIKGMVNHGDFGRNRIRDTIVTFRCLASMFREIAFCHIKREHNNSADRWDKMASFLNKGIMVKNEINSTNHIS